jgi:WD40 repeat protein
MRRLLIVAIWLTALLITLIAALFAPNSCLPKLRAMAMNYSADGAAIIIRNNGEQAERWDVATGESILGWRLGDQSGYATIVAFSPDRKRFAVGDLHAKVVEWDAQTGKQLGPLAGHTGTVRTVSYSHDGSQIITGSDDGTAIIWDSHSYQPLVTIEPNTPMQGIERRIVIDAAFSPDNKAILLQMNPFSFSLWESATGKLITQFPIGEIAESDFITMMQFLPDSRTVALVRGGDIAFWDIALQHIKHSVATDPFTTNRIRFSADGNRFVLWDFVGVKTQLWDAQTGHKIAARHTSRQPIIDGMLLANGRDVVITNNFGGVSVWDSQHDITLANVPNASSGVVTAIAPDGSSFITGRNDGIAVVWDAQHNYTVSKLCDRAITTNGQRVSFLMVMLLLATPIVWALREN